jgi:hypothetical protein
MHPVDRYKQYVIDRFALVAVFTVSGHCGGCQQHADNGGAEHRGCAPEFPGPRTGGSENAVCVV